MLFKIEAAHLFNFCVYIINIFFSFFDYLNIYYVYCSHEGDAVDAI